VENAAKRVLDAEDSRAEQREDNDQERSAPVYAGGEAPQQNVAELLKRLEQEVDSWGKESAWEQPSSFDFRPQRPGEPVSPPKPVNPFAEPEEPAEAPVAPQKPKPSRKPTVTRGRVIKTAVLLAVALVLGWTPLQRLLEETSAEASVNARVVTLRAPIDGKLKLLHETMQVGAEVKSGETIAEIGNSRADRGRVDDLRRQTADLQIGINSVKQQIQQLESFAKELRTQKDAFQTGRAEELQASAQQTLADIASAKAEEVQTRAALARVQQLKDKGFQSDAALDAATRDQDVASAKILSLQHELTRTRIELDAARKGLFVGDSYNDIPVTAQRLDDVTQQILNLRSDLSAKVERLAMLRDELQLEKQQYDALASASLTVPVAGRVWEILTSNGEVVSRGQPLFRVLDCGGAVVTAAVSEATYNALKLGQPATFHLRDDSTELPGRVVALNGMASVPSNLAIGQGIFSREPYHVTVAVPSLESKPDCDFGRTGKVTFDTAAPADTASAQ
jgi:multidrug resistance efflux pump